jgi:hypothetical protein
VVQSAPLPRQGRGHVHEQHQARVFSRLHFITQQQTTITTRNREQTDRTPSNTYPLLFTSLPRDNRRVYPHHLLPYSMVFCVQPVRYLVGRRCLRERTDSAIVCWIGRDCQRSASHLNYAVAEVV